MGAPLWFLEIPGTFDYGLYPLFPAWWDDGLSPSPFVIDSPSPSVIDVHCSLSPSVIDSDSSSPSLIDAHCSFPIRDGCSLYGCIGMQPWFKLRVQFVSVKFSTCMNFAPLSICCVVGFAAWLICCIAFNRKLAEGGAHTVRPQTRAS